jgi:hypothetical protein
LIAYGLDQDKETTEIQNMDGQPMDTSSSNYTNNENGATGGTGEGFETNHST